MITINLLPIEFRRQAVQTQGVSLRFIMILACAVALLLWIGLSFMLGTSKRELKTLTMDWTRLQAGAFEADKIILDFNRELLARKKIIDAIRVSDMSWAYVLYQASDLLPDTAWLSKLELQAGGTENWQFRLLGKVKHSEGEPPIKVTGKYINALKPALEQPIKTQKRIEEEETRNRMPFIQGLTPPTPAPEKVCQVQTATERESGKDAVLITFEGVYTLESKSV
ncbi:MAG: hypothetical protein HY586_05155 [Candidatus Omnitrophica bacterium]|nr:hypothetical protein [Candidatus Omnitrophota bacterium]